MTTAQTTRTAAQQAAYTRKVNRAMTRLAFDDAAERERILLADRDRLRAACETALHAATVRFHGDLQAESARVIAVLRAALAQSDKGE